MTDIRYLNLGCGTRYHPKWINVDKISTGPGVIAHDLSKGIPLPDDSCDVVYTAAMLEHLRRSDAAPFVRECHRVLHKGGVLRVGTPDLEKTCRLYLDKLAAASAGNIDAASDYEWMVLELLDQCVREEPGGSMIQYLRQTPLPNETFVRTRIGEEGREILNSIRQRRCCRTEAVRYGFLERLRSRLVWFPEAVRLRVLRLLVGTDGLRALEIGRFRLSGEVHHWLYDGHSLATLMTSAGFHDPVVVAADESRIPGWSKFSLDVLPDGTVIKPDLFFMEAIKS